MSASLLAEDNACLLGAREYFEIVLNLETMAIQRGALRTVSKI